MTYLEHIDINGIRKNLLEKHRFDPDPNKKVNDILADKISFKNIDISVVIQDYYNHLAGRACQHYFFLCPVCNNKCRKLYVISEDRLACRRCGKIKNKLQVKTPADRVMKIQVYLSELFNKPITSKRKKLLIRNITSHYNKLDDKYKMVYNTIAFKELQKWCLEASNNKKNNKDYQKAAKDMLKILRDIRKVLVFSGLSISKNSKLKI